MIVASSMYGGIIALQRRPPPSGRANRKGVAALVIDVASSSTVRSTTYNEQKP